MVFELPRSKAHPRANDMAFPRLHSLGPVCRSSLGSGRRLTSVRRRLWEDSTSSSKAGVHKVCRRLGLVDVLVPSKMPGCREQRPAPGTQYGTQGSPSRYHAPETDEQGHASATRSWSQSQLFAFSYNNTRNSAADRARLRRSDYRSEVLRLVDEDEKETLPSAAADDADDTEEAPCTLDVDEAECRR